jgi:hypothetical protein
VIYTLYGVHVRVVRLATDADFKRSGWDMPVTRRAGEWAVVEAVTGLLVDGTPWSAIRHFKELRADGGTHELDYAFADARARALATSASNST